MNIGKKNIVAGAIVLILGAIGGMVMAFYHGQLFDKGFYAIEHARFLMREGHSHGMPFALLNLIVGVLIERLEVTEKCKKMISWSALGIFLMPITLVLRGIMYPSQVVAPMGFLGAFFFLATAVLILKAALKPAK